MVGKTVRFMMTTTLTDATNATDTDTVRKNVKKKSVEYALENILTENAPSKILQNVLIVSQPIVTFKINPHQKDLSTIQRETRKIARRINNFHQGL